MWIRAWPLEWRCRKEAQTGLSPNWNITVTTRLCSQLQSEQKLSCFSHLQKCESQGCQSWPTFSVTAWQLQKATCVRAADLVLFPQFLHCKSFLKAYTNFCPTENFSLQRIIGLHSSVQHLNDGKQTENRSTLRCCWLNVEKLRPGKGN